VANERWWDLDGGFCDQHRICFDGEWWGWENVSPRDPHGLWRELLQGASRWHHYEITALNATPSTTGDRTNAAIHSEGEKK
jgi:hypothetical protein